MAKKVCISVKVPPHTAGVYIAGNIEELGKWQPDKIKMQKVSEDTYKITFNVKESISKIEFKFTLGSWDKVEKGKNGEEIKNHIITFPFKDKYYFNVFSWAKENKKHTLTGNIKIIKNFYSPQLNNYRDIIIYLPPSYYKCKYKRYPVLYMHDGQNLFDEKTSFAGEWHVDETCERLIKSNEMKEIIVVGIYNKGKERLNEYTPTKSAKYSGGKGKLYAHFLIETLMPYINSHFRTLKNQNAIMGSSLGGLISLYIAFTYPQKFQYVGAMSSSLWWNNGEIINYIEKNGHENFYLYVDIGTKEGKDILKLHRRLKKVLLKIGFKENKDFFYYEDKNAKHNEKFWSKRLKYPLLFFFGKKR